MPFFNPGQNTAWMAVDKDVALLIFILETKGQETTRNSRE